MFATMSNFLDVNFFQALNPLYAFPIVAVILCAFIVYAFGFKSPVQPPSFDGIEEEKKVTKKRKNKESNKAKMIQNGKQNGSTANKAQIPLPAKKKEVERSVLPDKQIVEKTTSEKKANKKTKSQNEKKSVLDKKKEAVSPEDTGEDGWVQLVSKKGRKSRKKDEASYTENQSVITKLVKHSEKDKCDETSPSEEFSAKIEEIEGNYVPEQKQAVLKQVKEDKSECPEICSDAENKEKLDIVEDTKCDSNNLLKIPSKENSFKSGKLIEETNKSKRKKKKNIEVMNAHNDSIVNLSEPLPLQMISELSSNPLNAALNSIVTAETPLAIQPPQLNSDDVEVSKPKEIKSSNVVFDELAGLYPEAKEQRKKKKVRRDH